MNRLLFLCISPSEQCSILADEMVNILSSSISVLTQDLHEVAVRYQLQFVVRGSAFQGDSLVASMSLGRRTQSFSALASPQRDLRVLMDSN